MSEHKKSVKRIFCGFLCLGILMAASGCGQPSGDSSRVSAEAPAQSAAGASETSAAPPEPSVRRNVSVSEDGTLEITRREFENTPMGRDGTWTIFVYMSGSTLESSNGKGTEDMEEMLAGASGGNVRFIVQTGGSAEWKNDFTPSDKLCRFKIADGKRTKLAELPLASMAESATLQDFLQWGVEKYPAEKMGVVFWGHGMGSLKGVCRDDLHRKDHLTLSDIDAALSGTADIMTDKFEFIGFDACYMGTIEAADIIASYARCMIGSEELEAANGWNYARLGALLSERPTADRTDIAKAICDGFFDGSDYYEDRATIAVTDLSQLDDILIKFNELSRAFCENAGRDEFGAFEARLDLTEHFSDENFLTGYSNTVDLAALVRCMEMSGSDELIKAIDKATIYKRMGKEHPNACGLTIYYPFETGGIAQLRTFSELSVSPYYTALLDKKLRSASPFYDPQSHDPSELVRLQCESVNSGSREIRDYWGGDPNTGDRSDQNDRSAFIETETLALNTDGTYSVKLAAESLESTAAVDLLLFRQSEESEIRYWSLGEMPLKGDGKTGVYNGAFDGKWVLCPDGTPLTVKRSGFGENVFRAPIEMFGRDTSVRFTVNFGDSAPDVQILGAVRQENGSGTLVQPVSGDVLKILCPTATKAGFEYAPEAVGEYTFDEAPRLIYDTLPDGNYFCVVELTDIFNNILRSDKVKFALENGEMKSAEILE